MEMKRKRKQRIPEGFAPFVPLVKAWLAARGQVALRVDQIRQRRVKYTGRLMPGLASRVADDAEAKRELERELRARPELFAKPRTRTIEGVVIGWRSVPRKLCVPNPAETAKRIRRLLPDLAPTLIRTVETVPVGGLKTLDDDVLASIGVEIVESPDAPQIRIAKDSLDKQVEAVRAQFQADAAGEAK